MSDLRVGDVEREAAAERLRESYAQGRLTMDEFNDRLTAALAATTQRELSQLTSDLPHTGGQNPPLPDPRPYHRSPYPATPPSYSRGRCGPRARSRLLPLLVAAMAIWLLASVVITPLRMFPIGGRLAILLLIVGVLRGIMRRVLGRRR